MRNSMETVYDLVLILTGVLMGLVIALVLMWPVYTALKSMKNNFEKSQKELAKALAESRNAAHKAKDRFFVELIKNTNGLIRAWVVPTVGKKRRYFSPGSWKSIERPIEIAKEVFGDDILIFHDGKQIRPDGKFHKGKKLK